MPLDTLTRRRFGLGVVAFSSVSIAGCAGDEDGSEPAGSHDDHDGGSDDLVADFDVIDRAEDETVANYHGHWHGELPTIQSGEHISLGARIEGADGDEIPIGDDEAYQLDAGISGSDNGAISIDSHGDHVHLHGESEGETDVTFQLISNDAVEWESSDGIGVEVADE